MPSFSLPFSNSDSSKKIMVDVIVLIRLLVGVVSVTSCTGSKYEITNCKLQISDIASNLAPPLSRESESKFERAESRELP
jgi:hypothetical protein